MHHFNREHPRGTFNADEKIKERWNQVVYTNTDTAIYCLELFDIYMHAFVDGYMQASSCTIEISSSTSGD